MQQLNNCYYNCCFSQTEFCIFLTGFTYIFRIRYIYFVTESITKRSNSHLKLQLNYGNRIKSFVHRYVHNFFHQAYLCPNSIILKKQTSGKKLRHENGIFRIDMTDQKPATRFTWCQSKQ